jgi:hypothetical protein
MYPPTYEFGGGVGGDYGDYGDSRRTITLAIATMLGSLCE